MNIQTREDWAVLEFSDKFCRYILQRRYSRALRVLSRKSGIKQSVTESVGKQEFPHDHLRLGIPAPICAAVLWSSCPLSS